MRSVLGLLLVVLTSFAVELPTSVGQEITEPRTITYACHVIVNCDFGGGCDARRGGFNDCTAALAWGQSVINNACDPGCQVTIIKHECYEENPGPGFRCGDVPASCCSPPVKASNEWVVEYTCVAKDGSTLIVTGRGCNYCTAYSNARRTACKIMQLPEPYNFVPCRCWHCVIAKPCCCNTRSRCH